MTTDLQNESHSPIVYLLFCKNENRTVAPLFCAIGKYVKYQILISDTHLTNIVFYSIWLRPPVEHE